MAGVDGAVGVLHDDAVDGEVEVGGFSDGEIAAEGSSC